MHCSTLENEVGHRMEGGDVLVAIAALVIEGRIPGKQSMKNANFHTGPHSNFIESPHNCSFYDPLCVEFAKVKNQVLELWQKGIPLCIDVLLKSACQCSDEEESPQLNTSPSENKNGRNVLVEQWIIRVEHRRITDKSHVNLPQLINAIRSQLYFSQLSSWLSLANGKISQKNISYRLSVPGETFHTLNFTMLAVEHSFPVTDIGNGLSLQICLLSLPRTSEIPVLKCPKCCSKADSRIPNLRNNKTAENRPLKMFDDRMYTNCNLKGKHRCEDFDDLQSSVKSKEDFSKFKRICNSKTNSDDYPQYQSYPSTSKCQQDHQDHKVNFKRAEASSSKDFHQGCGKVQKGEQIDRNNSFVNFNLFGPNSSKNCSNHSEPTSHDLSKSKSELLLDAILRSCRRDNSPEQSTNSVELSKVRKSDNVNVNVNDGDDDGTCGLHFTGPSSPNDATASHGECDINSCDKKSCEYSIKNRIRSNVHLDKHCDTPVPKVVQNKKGSGNFSPLTLYKSKAKQKLTFDDWSSEKSVDQQEVPDPVGEALQNCHLIEMGAESINDKYKTVENNAVNGIDIPSAVDQIKFKKSLDNATSMVFHSRTGLPLTSSPAPVRRGKSSFDYDSSINSVSAIGSALFSPGSDDESESDSSIVSPRSPDSFCLPKKEPQLVRYYRRGHPNNLLGTFEESVLNGRLEPVSTVHGFTAELGASGSFVPKHVTFPVTVFFYNLGDNDKVSTPYLGHINLGRKGYQVPKSGTIQVTLFNPLGTVVKMFVIMYDLSDMPPYSQTFLRQRTLYMPTKCQDENLEWGPRWLRYLIHLRFISSKSGKVYLHKDIRMIIFRKSDLDTATAHGIDMAYELRSFTHQPTNPKFSPRK
ncbi:protein FAM214A isoform X3 [Agrilus planipennis]|nr:protein FAM214A isoform X3 [Agrilus planipennis]